ncbi:stage II sporulation protein M [Terribacillus aidingensis]|uniref:Stage II sporulation protein M n=1 Tax=Terribacillus aidingensis TaxID=586416 RepID=A0A285NLZ4_9BACI|nr:stage II sporulation protein M [Terribacillus aidingensis]SNZ10489.1 stage II sporulation protein M [Terribacillus aidingensis]
MKQREFILLSHVRQHATSYLFMLVLFLIGIVFGAIVVNSMNFTQKEDLFYYLERFFSQLQQGQTMSKQEILQSSFLSHVKFLLFLYVLGLSIIGIPIIWMLLFSKGLMMGFSVGFLVNQLGWKGLMLAAAAVAPQNLIVIPLYLVAGTSAMLFSVTLLRKLIANRSPLSLRRYFIQYSVIFLILLGSSFAASMLETFLSNPLLSLLVNELL